MRKIPMFLSAAALSPFLVACSSPYGESPARFNLHRTLSEELDFTQRPAEVQRAARQDSVALAELASRYYVGRGAPHDVKASAKLFEKAAEAGNTKAQLCLAVLYSKGQGFRQSDLEAYKWLLIAERSSDKHGKTAKALKEQLSKQLSLGRQEIARSLAAAWLERRYGKNPSKEVTK